MKIIVGAVALLFILGSPAYSADPPWGSANGYNGAWNPAWNNGEYHGPYPPAQGYEGHPTLFGGYEEKFWVGDCRIERKWEHDGEYREEHLVMVTAYGREEVLRQAEWTARPCFVKR